MEEKRESASELLEAQAHIWNQAHSYMNSEILFSAIELGIPDLIHNHGQPMTLSQLVDALRINPTKSDCICRMMRLLVHSGFFVAGKSIGNEQEVEYELTPTSRLLLKGNPYTMAPALMSCRNPVWINSWRYLGKWLKHDDDPTSFSAAHGRTFFEFAANEPILNEQFNEALASEALVTATAVIQGRKEVFEGLDSLVDVGGGNGAMAKVITDEIPELKLTVFDLPHVVAGLQGSENLSFVGGDMFGAIPNADAVLLKCVLHDWNDEDCVKILKQCKRSIPSKDKGGKVLIIDIVMEDQDQRKGDHDDKSTQTQMFFDLQMMVLFMAKERSEEEWAKLFVDAGFNGYNIYHILGVRSLIEVYP